MYIKRTYIYIYMYIVFVEGQVSFEDGLRRFRWAASLCWLVGAKPKHSGDQFLFLLPRDAAAPGGSRELLGLLWARSLG